MQFINNKLFLSSKIHEAEIKIDIISVNLIRNLDGVGGDTVCGFVGDPVSDKVFPLSVDFVVFREDKSDGCGKFAGFGGGDGGFVDG